MKTTSTALETINSIVLGRTAATTRWGNLHINDQARGIRLEASAQIRLAAALGYIIGLAAAGGLEAAEAHAESITIELDGLAAYGGTVDHGGVDVPAYIVVLQDDGSLHGFKLAWFKYAGAFDRQSDVQHLREKAPHRLVTESSRGEDIPYAYSFNGGLLYHGAGDNSFACTLGDSLWQVHT